MPAWHSHALSRLSPHSSSEHVSKIRRLGLGATASLQRFAITHVCRTALTFFYLLPRMPGAVLCKQPAVQVRVCIGRCPGVMPEVGVDRELHITAAGPQSFHHLFRAT